MRLARVDETGTGGHSGRTLRCLIYFIWKELQAVITTLQRNPKNTVPKTDTALLVEEERKPSFHRVVKEKEGGAA